MSLIWGMKSPLRELLITLTNSNDAIITSSLFPCSNTGSGNRLALLHVNFMKEIKIKLNKQFLFVVLFFPFFWKG